MVLNFDFRNGVKWNSHLDHLFQSYGQLYFNTFRYISAKVGWLWETTRCIKNKNCFMICIGIPVAFVLNGSERRNPLQKNISLGKCVFWGTWVFLVYFGQKVPESPVSQLLNGVSMSSLPSFIVDLLTFKVCPLPEVQHTFFKWNFRGCWMADFTTGLQWAETAVNGVQNIGIYFENYLIHCNE